MHLSPRSEAAPVTDVAVLPVAAPAGTGAVSGTRRVLRTRITLTAAGDVEVESDVLRARRLPDVDGRTRVALVAPPATGSHDGRVEVAVAAGRALEIVELTGTGWHDVRHARTQWLLDVRVGRDAVLVWPSLPVVVTEGSGLLRLVHVDLAPGARAVLRETLVLGRAGAAGGRVRSTVRARLDDRPLLSETFVAEPAPALAGAVRPDAPLDVAAFLGLDPAPDDHRLDTLLVLGARLDHPDALQLEREGTMLRGPAARTHDDDLGVLVGAR